MTDLEKVKRCAELMGFPIREAAETFSLSQTWFVDIGSDTTHYPNGGRYNPLTNDAQAMELLKQFPIALGVGRGGGFLVACDATGGWCYYDDLNRAIVECVSKMPTEGSHD